jgi:hypothetical protein
MDGPALQKHQGFRWRAKLRGDGHLGSCSGPAPYVSAARQSLMKKTLISSNRSAMQQPILES